MYGAIKQHLAGQIDEIRTAGLFKNERVLSSPQQAHVSVKGWPEVLNMCNNYLGLANHPEVVKAAHESLDHWGNGLASVRFICGTQEPHKALEKALADFLSMEDTILYSSCWDANGGLFETILGPEDAIISDELNHASIIDGIRLCKAKRLRYKNNDMADLESKLKEASDARFRLIATDGVFSMDGIIADLKSVCDLADKYNALVMVDDSHAVGFMGKTGRGTHEYCDVIDRVDILTGTLGKALGGASGGYTCGRGPTCSRIRLRPRSWGRRSRRSRSAAAQPTSATGSKKIQNISGQP
jgi:glycine C-acetyltransferase